jgi:hypothetical protein
MPQTDKYSLTPGDIETLIDFCEEIEEQAAMAKYDHYMHVFWLRYHERRQAKAIQLIEKLKAIKRCKSLASTLLELEANDNATE